VILVAKKHLERERHYLGMAKSAQLRADIGVLGVGGIVAGLMEKGSRSEGLVKSFCPITRGPRADFAGKRNLAVAPTGSSRR
jgi:hypothetical protein